MKLLEKIGDAARRTGRALSRWGQPVKAPGTKVELAKSVPQPVSARPSALPNKSDWWPDLVAVIREARRYGPAGSLEARFAELRPLAVASSKGSGQPIVEMVANSASLDTFLRSAPADCVEQLESIIGK